MSLTGLKELDAKLRNLANRELRKIARAGIKAGLREMAKGIRREIPAQYKDAKKAIGVNARKARVGDAKGQYQAKVGAGVGKKAKAPAERSGSGVGLSAANIHWAILGTGERHTQTGASTGAMPAILGGIVQRGVATSEAAAIAAVQSKMAAQLAKSAQQ
jgi:hypothetical protein